MLSVRERRHSELSGANEAASCGPGVQHQRVFSSEWLLEREQMNPTYLPAIIGTLLVMALCGVWSIEWD